MLILQRERWRHIRRKISRKATVNPCQRATMSASGRPRARSRRRSLLPLSRGWVVSRRDVANRGIVFRLLFDVLARRRSLHQTTSRSILRRWNAGRRRWHFIRGARQERVKTAGWRSVACRRRRRAARPITVERHTDRPSRRHCLTCVTEARWLVATTGDWHRHHYATAAPPISAPSQRTTYLLTVNCIYIAINADIAARW